jgi:hypothetical protein
MKPAFQVSLNRGAEYSCSRARKLQPARAAQGRAQFSPHDAETLATQLSGPSRHLPLN